MEKLKILAVVGSLRRDSLNRQLAVAAGYLVKESADFSLLDYGDIPLMNQDFEYPAPEAVRRVRAAVKEADGLWFFTPEYNHSFPGVLKNLIDWLSRPESEKEGQVLSRKPAAVSGITSGMSGTAIAQDQLVMLISLLNMKVMNFPRVTVPFAGKQLDEAGKLRLNAESLAFLEKQAKAYVKFLGG
jgi:chromate reductase, NAD(P)H dehydrogenase (quinone)